MEPTLITRLPLLVSPSVSRPLSRLAFAGAHRLASVSFSASGCGVLRPRGGGVDAGVGSSVSPAAAALGEAAGASSEAILLSVQGMMCDGCAASVKRILESQPEVTFATVDFKEATAVVWTTPEMKVTEDWQRQCGVKLASHLGTCGFESRLQVIKGESWRRFQGLGVVPEAAVQDGGTVMIIETEIIECEVGVEIDMDMTGTERKITVIVAGVAATVLMITGAVAETEALVVAGVAAIVLMITAGVANTVCRLCEALVAPPVEHHLLTRDLLAGAMMTGLHTLVALQHKLNLNRRCIKQLRMNGIDAHIIGCLVA